MLYFIWGVIEQPLVSRNVNVSRFMGILIIPGRERWKWTWHFDKKILQYENPWHSEDTAE